MRVCVLAVSSIVIAFSSVTNAGPILSAGDDPESVIGWENQFGTFLIDWDDGVLSGGSGGDSTSSYESDIYRHSSPSWGVWVNEAFCCTQVLDPGAAEASIVAGVQDNDTPTGSLLAGQLIVRTTTDQVAADGTFIPVDQVLIRATAIDSYASFNYTRFLFRVSFLHPSISGFGRYISFEDPHVLFECGLDRFDPWGCNAEPQGAWTTSSYWVARRVNEPGTLALLAIGLIGMGFARRRKKA